MVLRKLSHLQRGLLCIGIVLTVVSVIALSQKSSQPQTIATTPADFAALRNLEARVQATIRNVSSAVVAVQSPVEKNDPPGYASGVIISTDGLVLSQAHVSHRYPWHGNPGEPERYRQPGEQTSVILHDGRVVPAELLGAEQTYDFSLLRLLEPGPYPFVPLESKSDIRLGDWVLKLGHPTGYRPDRGVVVRLGRVLSQEVSMFVTDCHITGGDSGGPLFDINGRLIGMAGDSEIPATFKNISIPLPERLYNYDSSSFIQSFVPSMLRSELSATDRSHRVERVHRLLKSRNCSPVEHWTQGAATASAFRDVTKAAVSSIVDIQDASDRKVALGTIVRTDGWILTVASLLPAEPRCRLPNQQVVAAEVFGVNRDFDLALLRVSASDLQPIEWATEKPGTQVGTLLAAPSPTPTPERPLLGMGIVSVATRELSGPYPEQRSHAQIDAAVPNMVGAPSDRGFRIHQIDDVADSTGIREGDILVMVGEKLIRSYDDVRAAAEGRLPGDRVAVRVLRDESPVETTMELKTKHITWPKRYGNLPTLFEHDMPLPPYHCGGPVIDLYGNAVGITMFRGRYGCLAIPADHIERLFAKLRQPETDSATTNVVNETRFPTPSKG